MTNLRELYISNFTKDLNTSFVYTDMNNLNSYYMSFNYANQITQIPDSIRNLTKLQKFELNRNAITNLGEGFAHLNLT